jgi:transposase
MNKLRWIIGGSSREKRFRREYLALDDELAAPYAPVKRSPRTAVARHIKGEGVGDVGCFHHGRQSENRRDVLNGILYILRTGALWADLPERYPWYQTCHRRFQQWVRSGVMRGVLEALAEDLPCSR